jgi:benzodiazapine receptor
LPILNFKPIPLLSAFNNIKYCIVASIFTRPQIQGWYSTLNKPSFNPPNWLFAPVWIILYVLIATAAYMVWKLRDGSATYKTAVIIYIGTIALNLSWSDSVFWHASNTCCAYYYIALLVAIILNISGLGYLVKLAAWLLIPYLLWVSFATLLNISIYILNK